MSKLLDTPQLAEQVGLSTDTLNKYRVSGCGPKYIKLGSAVRYRPSDVDEWVESRIKSSTSEAA